MNKLLITLFLAFASQLNFGQCLPVLDLPFKGNSLDSSGNNNDGIATGTPTLTADRFGNLDSAYEFGGVGDVDFFTVANNPTLQFTNELSISYWFKQCSFIGMNGVAQTVTNGYHVPIAKAGDGSSAQPGIYFIQNVNEINNQLSWSFTNKPFYGSLPISTNFTTTAVFNCINLCEWVHVVVVVNNTNLKVYFNGLLVQNQTINAPDFTVANTKPLYIGKMDSIWYPFKGTIDDIKIYNCALDQTIVSSLHGGFTDVLNTNVNPTFNITGSICSGSTLAAFPTTSINGISGTWSPAINNSATTTYTFKPDDGQCANSYTTTVIVDNTTITPTFTQVNAICSGTTLSALPTTSNNGIAGTWSPALNNTATTTYIFTPTIALCNTTATMTIIVNPSVIPTFTQVNAICSGATLSALPTTSNNGIAGTWSPALNNTATTTYTFTPTIALCTTTATMTVIVNPSVVPTFTQVNAICSGATLSVLPTTSNNGVAGTWSPALNNTSTTTYTFTPTIAQCTSTATMTIIVNPSVVPTFTQVNAICSGATLPALPTTSNNGIAGTWSPALNNTATTTYIFTPTIALCNTTATMTVIVNPNINIVINDGLICKSIETGLVLQGHSLNSNLPSTGFTFAWFLNGTQIVNANSNIFNAIVAGNYNLIATKNDTKCIFNSNVAKISEKIITNNFNTIINDEFSDYTSITVLSAISQLNISYQLDNNLPQSSNIFNNVEIGEHVIKIADVEGCINEVVKVFVIGYPKFFTPNGDGINDTWNIIGKLNQSRSKIEIYDRYGKLLSIIKPHEYGWDGLYNSYQMFADDYWFVLYYSKNGEDVIFKSHFSLKR